MQATNAEQESVTSARTYGALLTRLNDALLRARDALTPHARLAPSGSLIDLDALLAEFTRRRVRIALYGEVKAGKSTLLNAVAGAPLSPVAFDPLTSVPVRVTHGSSTTWKVGDRQVSSVAELERLMRDGAVEPATNGHALPPEVVVETNLELLELGGQVDLLDTPGVGSEARFDAVTAEAMRSLDAVVVVVRYPALFTQFTRQLMEALESDIGKLFVVWNLDAGCAELTAEERARHAETLRQKVAGAHELFLLDARAGFRAAQSGDAAGSTRAGLAAFTDALRRYAASGSRELTALRETAKRAQLWLTETAGSLSARQTVLDRELTDTRQRLQERQAAASAETEQAQARYATFEAAIGRLRADSAKASTKLADETHRQLRMARRSWVRSGNLATLAEAVATVVGRYADNVEAQSHTLTEALRAAAAAFGVEAAPAPRPRTEPIVDGLAPNDRRQRAVTGRWQRLRRSLWKRWYLPGLSRLEQEGLATDSKGQAEWFEHTARQLLDSARTVLDTRLAEIAQRADVDLERIKVETSFADNQAEFDSLSRDLPVVAAESAAVIRISTEARALLREA
jgi:dynamin family protein